MMKDNVRFLSEFAPKIGVTIKQMLVGVFDYFNKGNLDKYNKAIVIFFNTDKGVFNSTMFSNSNISYLDLILISKYIDTLGIDGLLDDGDYLGDEGYPEYDEPDDKEPED